MQPETPDTTDIFLWANNTDGIKNDLDIELFLFNKNYTPYSTSFSSDLNVQMKPMFLYDAINFVNMGAGTGLSVRDFELSEGEDNTLLRTDLAKVGRAETLIHLIEKQRTTSSNSAKKSMSSNGSRVSSRGLRKKITRKRCFIRSRRLVRATF